jgi:ADP-heptose:LPS heptosyltransferase
MIAVFPRFRSVRRTDKNWSAENYRDLIGRLQSRFPRLVIAILGAPGGAYFEDGVPKDCLDFINVPERHRMDLQIAALKRCVLAVGSMSGAILTALAAGCPSLTWGYPGERDRYHEENFLKTQFYYYSEMGARVQEIYELASSMIEGNQTPKCHLSISRRLVRAYRNVLRGYQ